MNNNLIPLKKLPPFINFCCTIGGTPTSYINSLTYEEQLLWLCQYLEKTVIPAINNNANAVAELQDLYETLKSYVDNYFENLNVQNEINNKLDQMVTNGTFDNILNQELLSEINNKVDDIISYNNGLNYGATLVIGDSYTTGYTGNSTVTTTPWTSRFKQLIGCPDDQFFVYATDGYGFCNGSFQSLLNNAISNITNKTSIKNIIVVGGCNDVTFSYNQISNAISQFLSTATSNFPNSKIYIGMIGNIVYHNGHSSRYNLKNIVRQAYMDFSNNVPNVHYLKNVEYVLQQASYISSDGVHPTQQGQDTLTYAIYQAFTTGSCDIIYKEENINFSPNQDASVNTNATAYFNNGTLILTNNNLSITYTNPISFINSTTLGTYNASLFKSSVSLQNKTLSQCTCYDDSNNVLFNDFVYLNLDSSENNQNVLTMFNLDNNKNLENVKKIDLFPNSFICDYRTI